MSKFVKLGEIAELTVGFVGTMAQHYTENGIPFLRSLNIKPFEIYNGDMKYVSSDFNRKIAKSILHTDDVVIVRTGVPGTCSVVPEKYDGCNCSDVVIVRPKHELVNPHYLAAYINFWGQKQISNNKVGAVQKHFNVRSAEQMLIFLPGRAEQERIGQFIKSLNGKIQTNNRINDNLQQMAYATYMHTFFGRKANGKLGDIIVENEKSSIQVGEAKEASGDYPFFTSGDAILRWSSAIVSGRNCFLNTGGNAGVKFYVGDAAYSTDTWCITGADYYADYLYLLLESLKPELNLKFFQGTGLKHLQKPLLRDKPIYIPTESEIKSFNDAVQPWMTMISENVRQNQELISLRNWLLPMLMNGQATISD